LIKTARRFFSNWQNACGLGIVFLFVVTGMLAPLIAPLSEINQYGGFYIIPDFKALLPVPPGDQVLLGTVSTGVRGAQIDVFYTLIWGTRSALVFGFAAAFMTALIGVIIGASSAFAGGWVHNIIMRITDAFLAFPVIAGIVLFVQLMSLIQELSFTYAESGANAVNTGLEKLFELTNPVLLALILFSWMPYARMTQAIVLKIKEMEYVQAAKALGASSGRVIFLHLIPNSIAPSIVMATSQVGGMVLLQAALNFIELDAGSEWGALLAVGRRWMIGSMGNPFTYWWVFLPITLTIVLFGIGWNLLGDGVNDWLNPRRA
jgi:peptide/nickel transport system permease protein